MITYSEELYIVSQSASLLDSPSMEGAELTKLPHGKKVTVKQKQDIWVKISQNRTIGWVCKFSLSDENPLDQSVIKNLGNINLNRIARKRASSYSTAATTRGLSEFDETIEIAINYEAVKNMETFHPTKTEINDFKNKGALK